MHLRDPVSDLRGVGPKKADLLKKMGVHTIQDLLLLLPHRYEDTSRLISLNQASPGQPSTFLVEIVGARPGFYGQKPRRDTFQVRDSTGQASLVFFNQPHLVKRLKVNKTYYVYGNLDYFRGQAQLVNPKIEEEKRRREIGRIIPIYPQVEGLKSTEISRLVTQALAQVKDIKEILPAYLKNRYGLLPLREALAQVHSPSDMDQAYQARQTLVFHEFLIFLLTLMVVNKREDTQGYKMEDRGLVGEFLATLPFDLTPGQAQVWEEVSQDLASGKRMRRLIQGDVGSGKTILALLASLRVIENGYQALFMAPTEILASQHYQTIQDQVEPLGLKSEILLGSTRPKRRREVLEAVETGACDLLVGTHALIFEDLKLNKLGLTITDEQHRFGVDQRRRLADKDPHAHGLIMSATPIPRTLEQVYYGDLDISTVEGLPQGRKPVKTLAINQDLLERSYDFIRDQLAQGTQAYVICPLIEESQALDLEAAQAVYEDLAARVFPDYRVALLHGQMPGPDKEAIMADFQAGRTQVLVSTTVIEVGVNVPNANILLVYNAERFGLAQLHQLRGRVGRGQDQAYCILYSKDPSDKAILRLKTMEESNDGFYIAQRDLDLRGGGDIFGTRQSGLPAFRIGDPLEDSDILHYALIEARAIVDGGHLNQEEEPGLNEAVAAFYLRVVKEED